MSNDKTNLEIINEQLRKWNPCWSLTAVYDDTWVGNFDDRHFDSRLNDFRLLIKDLNWLTTLFW